MKWELVSGSAKIWRCEIPAGWLVIHEKMFSVAMQEKGSLAPAQAMPLNAAVAMTFVPDRFHEWEIEPEVVPTQSKPSGVIAVVPK